ncbi:hypothetical protein AB5N19_03208 [Seiridium cardinale]|uniref:Uncharacterized protein n=1 Tax=Seiridium cardinale TaxID=138064 RepID=A0ABR2XGC7_9PEZI
MAATHNDGAEDPRLSTVSVYDRDEIIAQLTSFYCSLPHINAELVQRAPPDGWSAITVETLHDSGVHKTDEAVALLQRLPYLDNSAAFIAPETIPCDYRLLGRRPDSRTPGWAYDVQREDAEWPAWVIQLTSGVDREGACYMLDTTDGTVTKHVVTKFQYPATYAEGDPRAWRDRLCDDVTRPLGEQLDEFSRMYRELAFLGLPPSLNDCNSPGVLWRMEGDGPGELYWEETETLRRYCVKSTLTMGGPMITEKKLALRRLRNGGGEKKAELDSTDSLFTWSPEL